jgi:hypothetical protein
MKAFLLASALAAGSLLTGPAIAGDMMITTMGTILSGSDPTDLFGAGSNLAGDSYSLVVDYNALGVAYFTNGLGTSASDIGDPIVGYVTATVNGTSLTTDLDFNTSATLIEDLSDLYAANNGTDPSGDYASVTQEVSAASNFVPFADLQTDFFYALQSGDFGQDTYFYQNAADTQSASFIGTPTSIELVVPEPDTWALMASGLLGLGLLVRRRRA